LNKYEEIVEPKHIQKLNHWTGWYNKQEETASPWFDFLFITVGLWFRLAEEDYSRITPINH
jgi:hypothetical protein